MSSPGKQPERRATVSFSPTPTRHAYDSATSINIPSVRSYAPSPLRLAAQAGPGPSTLARREHRGILKRVDGEIRLASSVDEGTRENQEEARLKLGKRPDLKATDSFQLLTSKLADSSDSCDESDVVESSTSSLVGIIIDSADDLLTIEEAYNMLGHRLRQHATTVDLDPSILEPILRDIPGFVRALTRDVGRLLAPLSPLSSDCERSSSPCEGLPKRQGYTESEVRYRREASGVGHAALRWLAFMLFFEPLYSAFTIADLSALLDLVLTIPFTPKLPTPNAKRTYALAIYVLAHIRIPVAAVIPVKTRLMEALRKAVGEGSLSQWGGGPAQDKSAGGNVKARLEGFSAISNILTAYPAVFVPHHRELLPVVLKGLTNSNAVTRQRAQLAAGAFVTAKIAWMELTARRVKAVHKELAIEAATPEDVAIAEADWATARNTNRELESGCLAYLRRSKATTGVRETEYAKLDKELKTQMSADSKWACATWATLVSLLGEKYVKADMYKDINHIMKVTIAAWVKPARLVFARLAWEHAIHAYFHHNASSRLEAGVTIKSFDLDAMLAPARVASILSPVTDALKATADADDLKLAWVKTLATQSAAVIYAFSGAVLTQPGEVSLARLDQCFDAVVTPPLTGLLAGNDDLKLHAWGILSAITRSSPAPSWSIDRLLCARYIDGQVANTTSDAGRDLELAYATRDESINPSEIPSWGATWTATRLISRNLVGLFERALGGVRDIQDVDATGWVRSVDGLRVVPRPLSDLWRNLLRALMVSRISATHPTPVFVRGMREITRCIVDSLARDPQEYLPEGLKTDPLLVRLGLAQHLINIAIEECGDALAVTRIENEAAMYGADADGHPSPAGVLLDHILRIDITPAAHTPYVDLLATTLRAGVQGPGASKLLGDLTNRLPWLGDSEALQLAIWRTLASNWCDYLETLAEPATKARTNHTGLLLVNLLSAPFRDRAKTSLWHTSPSEADLATWRRLLHATVDRSRAKRFGTNGGVLEPLAAHLQDWQDDFAGTSSTATTIACLAEAVKCVAFAAHRSNPGPFAIDDSYVPVDFFRLVCPALATGGLELLKAVDAMFATVPAAFVPDVLDCFQPTLVTCLCVDEGNDAARSSAIDSLYITVLGSIQRAVDGRAMKATSATLVQFEPVWAARLLSAKTPDVLAAFQAFWQATFGAAEVQYQPATSHFLRQVIKAAPEGWITAPGLAMESLESVQEPSQPSVDSAKPPEMSAETPAACEADVSAAIAPVELVPASQESCDVFGSSAPPRKRKRLPAAASLPLPNARPLAVPSLAQHDHSDEDIGECVVVETPASTPSLLGRVGRALSGFNSFPTFFSPRRACPSTDESQPKRKRRRRSSPAPSPVPSSASSSRCELFVEVPGAKSRRGSSVPTEEDGEPLALTPYTGVKRKREEEQVVEAAPTPLAARRQLPAPSSNLTTDSLILPSPSKRSKAQHGFLEAVTEAERLGSAAALSLDQEGLLLAMEKVNSLLTMVQDGLKARTRELRRRQRH